MKPDKKNNHKKRSLIARVGKGLLVFILSLIALVILILLLIQTKPVQNFARKKIVSYLENKLHTKVEIGKLDIDFPKMLVLENVYFEDQQKDTLLAGGKLKVDISMLKLLSSEVEINEIRLEGITAKIKRQLPDTAFNFQYIIDAFASDSQPTSTDTAAMKISIDKIIVDKTRLVYKDVVTGNDVDVYLDHFDTEINIFDPQHMRFDVPGITLRGVRGSIKQTEPIEIVAVNTNPDTLRGGEAPAFLRLTNDNTTLKDISIFYSNTVSGMETQINFDDLVVQPRDIDMENSLIAFDKVELNKLEGYLVMKSTTRDDVVKITDEKKREVNTDAMPWVFTVNDLKLNNNDFKFDDNTKPRARRGMDYAHLNFHNLTLHANDLLFNNDTIAVDITKGNFEEQSGFQLNTLQADIEYTDKGATITDLLLETPGTTIKRSFAVRYPSLEAVQKNMNSLEIFANLDNTKIQVKDILTFAPQLASQPGFKNPNDVIYIDSKISGTMGRLNIENLRVNGFKNTSIDVSGTIANAADPNNFNADLNIRKFATTRGDIISLSPPNTIPSNITLPENISLNGIFRGGLQKMYTDLNVNTTLGNASIKGTIANATSPAKATYDANIETKSLNLGTILQQPENFGMVSASFSVNGKGMEPETANADLKGVIQSAQIKGYNYKNLKLDGTIANQKLKANASMKDPNLDFNLLATADISGNLPGFTLKANIDSIKTKPLNLTPDAMFYHGTIEANFPTFNPDALKGNLFVTNSVLVMNKQRMALDSLSIDADYTDGKQDITLTSDIMYAKLEGKYKLQELGDIMMEAIQPYYAINTGSPKPAPLLTPYDFNITASIYDHPSLKVMVPELKDLDQVNLNAHFSSYDGWNANLSAPYIEYGTNTIDSLTLQAYTQNNELKLVTNVQKLSSGSSIALFATRLDATVANNNIDFGLGIKDKLARDLYKLKGSLNQQEANTFALSLDPDSLTLNYDRWNITPGNVIRFGPNLLNAKDFTLSKNNQQLIINSQTPDANSPLEVRFNNFKLATLTAFVQTDTLLVNGTMNGNAVLKDIMSTPQFTSDLTISDLAINNDTLGNLNAKVNNTRQNVYDANVTLSGRGNDVKITGDYTITQDNKGKLDLNLAINALQLNTLEGASFGNLKNAEGYLSGYVKVGGSTDKPDIDGKINFNNTAFAVPMLNSRWKIDNESLVFVDNTGFRFDTFTIKDSANNTAVIDGMAYTTNYTNYKFDLEFRARNFQVLNSTKQDNNLYYGDLLFNADLNITGTETLPVIDGSFRVNEKTNLTIVIPQPEPGVVSREGIVKFVDKDATLEDSLFTSGFDSLNTSPLQGFDVTVNIEVDPKATFNMVLDEVNGDFLSLQGEAALNGGIDKSGKVTLVGTYELVQGSYELSFNLIKRKFDIQKGSKIVWIGEPTEALVDVTAIYKTDIPAADLVRDELTTASTDLRYRQKLPFEVLLMMDGKLLSPELTFDIQVGEARNIRVAAEITDAVTSKLARLRAEPSELNKQVFAVLLLNRFISQDPFASSGGGFNAGTYARQSVSRILTDQLNNLASNLVAGVDINFDLNSQEDYTTGEMQNRTDLNVEVSKRLLNDRLKVSVGSNYQLEGPQSSNQKASNIAGDLALEYALSKDGRYLLRAYRKNLYEGVIEGYVIETGIGFRLSIDYNKFKEIFSRKKPGKDATATEKDMQKQGDTKDNTPVKTPASSPKGDVPAPENTPSPATDKLRNDEEN